MGRLAKNNFVDSFKNTPNFFTEKTSTTVEDKTAPLFVNKDFGEPQIKAQPKTLPGQKGYLNAETGYLLVEDKNEIASLKLRQSNDVLKNLLLGHYDKSTGEYLVSENLLIELLLIVKKLERSFKLSHFCSSLSNFSGFGTLEFVVQTKHSETHASSNLYLLETIDKLSGLVENTNVVLVATYEDDYISPEEYNKNMFKSFNVFDPSVQQEDDYVIDESANLWITRRKKFLKALNSNIMAKQNYFESKLLNKRLEILSQLGPYGVEVIQAFETLKTKGRRLLGEDLTGQDLNEMLELAVQSKNGKYKDLQTKYYEAQKDAVAVYTNELEKAKELETPLIKAALKEKPAIKKIGEKPPEMKSTPANKDNKPKEAKKEEKKEVKKEAKLASNSSSSSIYPDISKINKGTLSTEEKVLGSFNTDPKAVNVFEANKPLDTTPHTKSSSPNLTTAN